MTAPGTQSANHEVRLAPRKFALDRERAKLGGVCAGMANWLGTDPLLVRLGFAIGTVAGLGSLILVYLVIWFVGAVAE
ncbi:PspC domain-containing protein [Alteraurantiacibacter palmitatis]|uniref:PspC domain-containing protein n=1 Tax=Alteraurantiacibacter palmitatis TaxID=2054628 RepID=A0ABV7E876_9SPHN